MSKDAGRYWAEFFLAEHHAMTIYALALAGNAADAQDLIQDVLVRMVAEERRVHDAKAYVLRCLRNLAFDRRRTTANRPAPASPHGNEVAFLADNDADLDGRESLARLRTALEQLGPDQREVIVLKSYCELTFRQIAETLGQPIGTVASTYRRGLEALRALYSQGEAHVC